MTRIDPRPWASLILLAGVLAYVGCTTSAPDPGPTATARPQAAGRAPAGKTAADKPATRFQKLLAALGKPAAIAIVSGEMNGYMEPCGCSDDQEGGLIRRYDLVDRLKAQGWPVALFDLGTLVKNPTGARGGFDQAKIKFIHALKALELLKYSALALSTEDLRVGVGEALGQFENCLGESTKVVAANVEVDPIFAKVLRPSVVTTAGPVKIGVTAVIDPESLQTLNDPEKALFTSIKPPDAVLPAVLGDLEAKSDFQVLLVQGPPELAKLLAGAYPGFDIVVATSQYDEVLDHDPAPINDGKTMLVTVGRKGKYVGLFAIYPGQTPALRFHLVMLDKSFDRAASPMKTLIQNNFRNDLKLFGVVEKYSKRPYTEGAPGATFAGALTCKECHPNTYYEWWESPHARAVRSLKRDPKPDTIYDADCVTCHTTGFEFVGGWRSEAETPYLAGSQCENCHGPGSKHAAQPDNAEFTKRMKVTAQDAENRLCATCHDQDNSPHFDFAEYWAEIEHNGRDTYTDPKVHVGIEPKTSAKVQPPAR
jgi:Cytochrome c554 and c-prime